MSWNLPGESRYGIHSIDHFALEVPSLAQARHFFEAFGLDVSEEGAGLALRAHAGPHVWARLYQGPKKRLAYLSLSCYGDEYEALCAQALAAGARAAPRGTPHVSGEGRWFLDPDGNLVQLKAGPKMTPGAMVHGAVRQAGPNERGMCNRSAVPRVRPRRLSHVLLFTPDIDRALGFWSDAFGLRLSDRGGDAVAFMHGRHGSDHHLVAFAASSAPGWHHSAWDVDGIDEVGRGGEQMREAGYAEGWGTGHHVLGSNFFHYVRDPWGSFAEYSADIDYIPMGAKWPAGSHPAEDSLYQWGPPVPEYFIRNVEAG
ncbi:VOC family protein [Alicycliphilus denitrificans]|uniref:Metapyrocatechase n=1 Tax=Alicycliphilus denitrificans TaxID=179636 RepID=A0A420KDM7_9BURK|nr:VOC family protein [Alicycliphilus denitrificans]RKJ97307.1 metapyrocatechase [Alicycliphilus denitrificans]